MWHLKVPKKFHVYWGSGVLSYLRYRTVDSFMALNPDWEIHLWMPKFPAKVITWTTTQLNYQSTWPDFLPELLNFPIKKHYIDFEELGMSNDMSEVHKSDFLRYIVLASVGGVYSDMDIIYFAPIEKLKVNTIENSGVDTFVCMNHYGHSNGFFLSAKDSPFFGQMAMLAKDGYIPSLYQSLGPNLCNKHFPTIDSIKEISSVVNIGMEAVYAHDGQHIPEIYGNGKPKFNGNSIGCHWYGGHPKSGEFLNRTKGGILEDNSILGRLCKTS